MAKRIFILGILSVIFVALALPVSAHGDGSGMASMILGQVGITKSILFITLAAALFFSASAWFVVRRGWLQLSLLDYGIIGLISAAAVLHLLVGLTGDLLLLANGLGFFGLMGLLYLPLALLKRTHLLLVGVTILYTLVTIVGYFVTHSQVDNLGLASKGIEIMLILSLLASVIRLPILQRVQMIRGTY